MKIIAKLLLRGLAVFVTAYLLRPGIFLSDFITALIVVLVLAVANTIVKPILLILTFPLTVMTLGLFTLIVNGVVVLLVSYFVPGFRVQNLLWAILFSTVLSFINTAINWIAK